MNLGARVGKLIEDKETSQTAVAIALGLPQQNLSALIRRDSKTSEHAAALARHFGVSLEWLLTGGDTPDDTPEAPSQSPTRDGVAHDLSLDVFKVPHLSTWEELMQAEPLPELFRVAVPDDALAPKIQRGAELVLATGTVPRPSQVILVRERATGKLHLRRYAQGTGDNWQARAPNVDYPTFDSTQLELLATLKWVRGEDA
jgi:hypothetical protein